MNGGIDPEPRDTRKVRHEDEVAIEKVVDVVIRLKGWRLKIVAWLWPGINSIREILNKYCWKDCG